MRTLRLISVVSILAAAAAAPVYAQQAADAPKSAPAAEAPAADTAADTAASDAEAAATAALIAKANANAAAAGKTKPAPLDATTFAKKVKQGGWRPEVKGGATVYCRDAQEVGSRFTTHRCMTEVQLAGLIEQQEFEKDQLRQRSCGGSCGGQ
jgi:hypothetical protein